MYQNTVMFPTYSIFMWQVSLSDSGSGSMSPANGPDCLCSVAYHSHSWLDVQKHVTQELGQVTSCEALEFFRSF